MKKLMTFLFALTLCGCAPTHAIKNNEARVLAIEDNRILVELKNEQLYYDEIYLLVSEYTDWVDTDMKSLKKGDILEVDIDDKVMQSLPPQVNVFKILKK